METDEKTGALGAPAQRHISVKTSVGPLLHGRFAAKEGWEPHVVLLGGAEAARVNLIGVIVAKPAQSHVLNYEHAMLEDGTGRITLRSFNTHGAFDRVAVGDVCLAVGKPREYAGEIYLVPEIVRRLDDPAWLQLRAMELSVAKRQQEREQKMSESPPESPPLSAQEDISTAKINPPEADETDKRVRFGDSDVIDIIRSLDAGDGAKIGEVILRSENPLVETIIEKLLRKGDIFEMRPGQVKILE